MSGGQAYVSFLYDLNIPIVSDYAGAFFDVREENAKSSLGSIFGSLAKGVVDGLGGTIEGVVHMATDPIGALEGINTILAYPEETLPALLDGVKEVWNEKVIKGSPEDRANLLGQAGFEIASWLVGAGEAKAASTVAKTGKTAQLIKTADKVNEVSRVAKVANVTTDLARYKAGLTALGKDIAKGLDSKILEGAKKLGNSFDQVRYNMNRLILSMQPQLAGIGNLEDRGSTADKIEGLYSAVKKRVGKKDAGGSGIHIGGPVDEVKVSNSLTKEVVNTIEHVEYGEHFTRVKRKKELKPNVSYETLEVFRYETNSRGDISRVEGQLQLGEGKRNEYA